MYTYVKFSVDLAVAIISLFLLAFVLGIVSIFIKVDSKGPVLFKQQRSGKDKKPFTIYKFRTMTTDAPKNAPTCELQDATHYITRVGNVMRKLSIDELPQLLNIIKGEMSFVGPRPVILNEVDLIYERDKYNANSCKPGITGWAQANGRDEINFYDKARMDGEYTEKLGLMMDLRCLAKTVETILFAKGYQEGARTIPMPQQPAIQVPAFYSQIKSVSKAVNRPIRRRQATSEAQHANT